MACTQRIEGIVADDTLPNVFSARAEAEIDVQNFARLLGVMAGSGRARVYFAPYLPAMGGDVVLEVHTSADVTLASMLNAARMVPDGHVLLQTIRPCPIGRNPLHRLERN